MAGADLPGFFLPIRVRQTATTAADSTVWTMRNTHATRSAMIRRLWIYGNNDVAGGIQGYDLRRFSGATPTGGVAVVPVELRTSSVWVSCITDARVLDTGLTVAGVTFEGPWMHVVPTAFGGVLPILLDDDGRFWPGFELSPGQGLAIRLTAQAIVGQSIQGGLFWDERN